MQQWQAGAPVTTRHGVRRARFRGRSTAMARRTRVQEAWNQRAHTINHSANSQAERCAIGVLASVVPHNFRQMASALDEDEDAAFETDFHTEYESGVEINSDYFTDGELVFDSDFSPEDVITSFQHGAEVTLETPKPGSIDTCN